MQQESFLKSLLFLEKPAIKEYGEGSGQMSGEELESGVIHAALCGSKDKERRVTAKKK